MRRAASDLYVQRSTETDLNTHLDLSKVTTVDHLKEWRREFEKSLVFSPRSLTHSAPNTPNSNSSDYEGHSTYIFDEENDPLFQLDSPKEELVRSSTMTDGGGACSGGSLLHSLVLANAVPKVRSLLKLLLLLAEDTTTNEGGTRGEKRTREESDHRQELLQMLSATDATGATPLFLCKSAVMTDLLLTAGSEPNHQNNVGLTALHRSALFARVDVVCRLLEGGARADVCDGRGRSPLEVCKLRLLKPQHKSNRRLKAVVYLLQEQEKNADLKKAARESHGGFDGGCCVVA